MTDDAPPAAAPADSSGEGRPQRGSGPDASERARRRRAGAAVLLLCVASACVRAWVVAPRTEVGHGDIAHYVNLARGLAEGRGLAVDYVATWLHDPGGIPTSGVAFWKPLPSIVGALGMLAAGASTLRAASLAMIVATAIAPWIAYRIGTDLLASRRIGLVAAFLVAFAYVNLYVTAVPLSYGPSFVLGTALVWTIGRSLSDPRHLPLVGALVGLAGWNRSDAVLWIPVALGVHLLARGRIGLGRLAGLAAAWLLALAPLWIWRAAEDGTATSGSLARAALLTSYADLYALPEDLTLERLLAPGATELAGERLVKAGTNAFAFVTAPASAGSLTTLNRSLALFRGEWHAEQALLFAPVLLALVGLPALLSRRLAAFWAYAALAWLVYCTVFPHTSVPSFRACIYGTIPVWLVAAAAGLDRVLRLVPARPRPVVLALALAGHAWLGIDVARSEAERLGAVGRRYRECHDALVRGVLRPAGADQSVLLVPASMIHELHANTRIPMASIPWAGEGPALGAAARVGATHLLASPPLAERQAWIAGSEALQHLGRAEMGRCGTYDLYRIR